MVIQEQHNLDGFLTLSDATRLLNVNRIGYYKWLRKNGPDPDTIRFEIEIRDEMQKIAVEFPRYGYQRMTIELQNRGYHVNHKRVLRLMQEDNLLCVRRHFKPLTTDSNHNHKVVYVYIQIY